LATLAPELVLPPPFAAVRLRELGDAFAHAISIAPTQGAGTLVYVGRFDLAEFAVVLEPEEPLRAARRSLYAGMSALAETLVAHAEPETAINVEWPDALFVNFGLVGGGRIAWPGDAVEDKPPAWLVFGGMIRLASMSGQEPGTNPSLTALDEEGFGALTADSLIESFSRHFMATIDAWQADGFGVVARSYLSRLEKKGAHRAIDEQGDLLTRGADGHAERKTLLDVLAAPSWLDPQARGPRA
jgi:biotin-(acetyl-CoA carboxylase) ligase